MQRAAGMSRRGSPRRTNAVASPSQSTPSLPGSRRLWDRRTIRTPTNQDKARMIQELGGHARCPGMFLTMPTAKTADDNEALPTWRLAPAAA